jgi:hypothetical protein
MQESIGLVEDFAGKALVAAFFMVALITSLVLLI